MTSNMITISTGTFLPPIFEYLTLTTPSRLSGTYFMLDTAETPAIGIFRVVCSESFITKTAYPSSTVTLLKKTSPSWPSFPFSPVAFPNFDQDFPLS